ncbi:MAG: NAD(P)-binding protein [Planctomycetota bacterium]
MAKQKIAVLGGGLGALSAVYGLTSSPGWQDRYDITVYQMGWRLGGKGASGRNMDPGMGARIEEHGLHIWFGFYNHAFRMMIDTYDEFRAKQLAPESAYQSVNGERPAFRPLNMVSVMEDIDGTPVPWTVCFPTNEEELGSDNIQWSPWTLMLDLFGWLVETLDEILAHPATDKAVRDPITLIGKFSGALEAVVRRLYAGWWTTSLASSSVLHLAEQLVRRMSIDPRDHTDQDYWAIEHLLTEFLDNIEVLAKLKKHDTGLRRLFITADLARAIFRGAARDGVLHQGWDVIDNYDFREWLVSNGCRSADSAPVQAAYSLVFAYVGGDVNKPNFAAGVCTRAFARILFTYKRSILWKMRAGMGDIVFSPLYMVLKDKGVKFEFFHKVTDLKLTHNKNQIAEVHLDVQATMKPNGDGTKRKYDPLIWVKGCPCWPNQPLYDQLEQGDQWQTGGYDPESAWCPPPPLPDGKLVLRDGVDFDNVVLGISLAALKHVAKDVIAHDQRWQDMVEHVKTVQTQACQLWFNKTAQDMGWDPWYPKTDNPLHEHEEDALVGGHVEPLDTWSDMCQVIPAEDGEAKSIAYFCGALKDTRGMPPPAPPNDRAFPKKQTARVKANTKRMLLDSAQPLWPQATQPEMPTALDWDVLVDPRGAKGERRLDAQYFRANSSPSERYVLSVKGSTQFRLRPGESGYTNLFLAGDWTYNGLNVGCVEAAVMSGLDCAQAIRGVPSNLIARADFWSPNYVFVGGAPAFPGPYEFPNVTLTAFTVASDYTALKLLCDRWLNQPAGGAVDYRPLLSGFLVLVADFPKIIVNPGYPNAFNSPEIDINLAIPVVRIKKNKPCGIAWFFPYLFVNNPWAMASGREAYGFFKEYSDLTIPRSAVDSATFRVQTQCVEEYGEHAQTGPATVLEVRRKDAQAFGETTRGWTKLEPAMQSMFGLLGGTALPGLELIGDAWRLLINHEFPLVFLKQFPAIDGRHAACFQRIVEAPLKIKRFGSAGALPGKYHVSACQFASHPIASDMGMFLDKGSHYAVQDCLSAVTLTVDATLELGYQVWP